MNYTDTKALLEKYIESETSLAEEQQLLELFRSGDYPPEFENEANLVRYFAWEVSERKKYPEFERELKKREDSIPVMLPRYRRISRTTWMVAASIILLGGLLFTFRHEFPGYQKEASNKVKYKTHDQSSKVMMLMYCTLISPDGKDCYKNVSQGAAQSLAIFHNLNNFQVCNTKPKTLFR